MADPSARKPTTDRPIQSPGAVKAAVWSVLVGLPVAVAVMVLYAEPPLDFSSPWTWLAVALWIAIDVAVLSSVARARTARGSRLPQYLLVALLLGLVALLTVPSGLQGAATAVAGGFWGLFLGIGFYFAYVFSYRRRLLYCRTCATYRWMIRTSAGFACLNCKSVWRGDSGGPLTRADG